MLTLEKLRKKKTKNAATVLGQMLSFLKINLLSNY